MRILVFFAKKWRIKNYNEIGREIVIDYYICVAHAKCRCANDRKILFYIYGHIHDFGALNSNVCLLDIHFVNTLIINCLNIEWPQKQWKKRKGSTIFYGIFNTHTHKHKQIGACQRLTNFPFFFILYYEFPSRTAKIAYEIRNNAK